MQLKTLVKNSAAVALTAGAAALHFGQPNLTASFAALASGTLTFVVLPHAIRLSNQIPDAFKNLKNMSSNALHSVRKKGKTLLNKFNPNDPDQNILLGSAAGLASSKVFASAVVPLVDAGIEALANTCHLTKATKTFLKHPQLVADVGMTIAGGLVGAVCSDSRLQGTARQTTQTLQAHAASDAPPASSSSSASTSLSNAASSAANALSGALSTAAGALSPKAPSKPKSK